ncbi:MAG: RNA-binding transcriptional accessory protein [Bacteroidetes bacterium]|nr:RNA-binding transcriptional accessory protein [Bacteroidota bacterium]
MTDVQIISRISSDLTLKADSVKAAVTLLDDGSTIPFITRYRREVTGGLDEEQLRSIEEKLKYYRLLSDRKATVLESISEQGKLTPELKDRIEFCFQMQELEDLYLPYKPKRKTRATIARAKGLEPLAQLIFDQETTLGSRSDFIQPFINPELGVTTEEEALAGARDIICEWIGDHADIRKSIRELTRSSGSLGSQKKETEKTERTDFEIYYEFKESVQKLKPHQILALNRGEKEGILKVNLEVSESLCIDSILSWVLKPKDSLFSDQIPVAAEDAYGRLIQPSIERELRTELTESADLHAIEVFAKNLQNLLLQPPVFGKTILGIDPGFVSGCKVAVVDSTGKYLDGETIYPTEPRKWIEKSEKTILDFVRAYRVEIIAIGNGTASREVEQFIADVIKNNSLTCAYLIVSEAGASVYSASKIAAEEFPDLEAAQRGNISIARRVLDPLAELVKIDPKSIGVGLYQHDVDQKMLENKLGQVVESCVNHVGVNLNTCSVSLLTHVSGLNKRTAQNIIQFRESIGKFKSRQELLQVKGLGEHAFVQAAGFLRIPDGDNPLDNTSIHPESYSVTQKLLAKFELDVKAIQLSNKLLAEKIRQTKLNQLAAELGVGEPTLALIVENLQKPGRDPREDAPAPILRTDVLKFEDLKNGMKLKGTVRNVVDFGAFVDIGVKHDGLVHVSEMGRSFVKNPHDVLGVGDVIDVWVKSIDTDRQRIGLSMRPPDGPALPGQDSARQTTEGRGQKTYQQGKPAAREPLRQETTSFEDKLSLLKSKFGK